MSTGSKVRRHSDRFGATNGPARRGSAVASLARAALVAAMLLLAHPAVAQQRTYSYDERGRLTRVDYSAGGSIEYVYDANGSLIETITTASPPQAEITVFLGDQELQDGQPGVVAFGTAVLGGSGGQQAFTVRNDGAVALSALAVALPPGFALVNALASSLDPSQSDMFVVRLETQTAGEWHGAVSIASSDSDENPFTFPVSGSVPPAAPRRFDFGTATSPLATGYARVAPSTTYQAGAGFGWTSGQIDARDRGQGDDLARDFAFTKLATFAVDLPSGSYDIVLTIGDTHAAHDQMGIYLEGSQVDSVQTAPGEVVTRSYRVAVIGDQLNVTLDDLGGSDENVVINGLVALVRRGPARRLSPGTLP